MATAAIDKEMLELETSYWEAMKAKDAKSASESTADVCVVASASGVATIDRKTFAQMMKDASWKLNAFKFDDFQVSPVGDDLRIVAYKVHEDLTVDGKPVKMDAADTSVWVRQNGKWECAAHTESLLGDAYGRDRKLS